MNDSAVAGFAAQMLSSAAGLELGLELRLGVEIGLQLGFSFRVRICSSEMVHFPTGSIQNPKTEPQP